MLEDINTKFDSIKAKLEKYLEWIKFRKLKA